MKCTMSKDSTTQVNKLLCLSFVAQINCSEYVSLSESLLVEMHVPDVTLRVNKPN